MSELLTIEDVAKLLKMSTRSVFRLKADRKIGFIKIRGAVRFSAKEVERLLETSSSQR